MQPYKCNMHNLLNENLYPGDFWSTQEMYACIFGKKKKKKIQISICTTSENL